MSDKEALKRVAEKLRRAGANLPAPEVTGTIEGSIVTGLCIALLLVEIEIEALAQPEQEPVAWMSPSWIDPNTRGWQSDSFESIPIEGWLPIYTTPPQRTWVGLEGAEAGWFCHTDFLNARKYTKKQREHICCQLLSEAQSWDIKQYQLMMHDSTKIKENT
jgi:hypothetical protein